MAFCDGCGSQVDDAHIRRRIERLELSTRFRPIHIQVLLMDSVPLGRTEDYFYRAASSPDQRSTSSRDYFNEIVKCSGFIVGPGTSEEIALAEFQHRGFYLAYAVECPVEPAEESAAALERAGPTVLQRVEKSYKPKYIALISASLTKVIPLFERSEIRLLLNYGKPFMSPLETAGTHPAGFGVSLSDQFAAQRPRST
jgi:hypothetical protein